MHDWRFHLWALLVSVFAVYFITIVCIALFEWCTEWAALRWYESPAYLISARRPWYVRSFERRFALRGQS